MIETGSWEAAISDPSARIEFALSEALASAGGQGAPPGLFAAMQHAVFPGGGRIRPRLCLAVAAACGDPNPSLSAAAAAAIELIHCASLVHDDLPCFDNSALRRGRPSVHIQFGAPLAVLAGDALIVQAFDTLGRAGIEAPAMLPRLVLILAGCSGMPGGIAGGQGWECEPCVDLDAYGRAKTGALFAAAAMAGAASCGEHAEPWRAFGELLGQAYQVADDLADALVDPIVDPSTGFGLESGCNAGAIGKPTGRDRALGRPNAALQLGPVAALGRLEALVAESVAALPPCRDKDALARLVSSEVRRLLPVDAVSRAAA